MLFDVQDITSEKCATTIEQAVLGQDPTAQVTVNLGDKRVQVEGLLSQQQAIEAMAKAGFAATTAAPHSGEGSECCGGCS